MELKCKQCAHELPTTIMCGRCFERNSYGDSFVVKSDLRKLVEEIRADQYESADVNIWYSDGCKHSADRIEQLLGHNTDHKHG